MFPNGPLEKTHKEKIKDIFYITINIYPEKKIVTSKVMLNENYEWYKLVPFKYNIVRKSFISLIKISRNYKFFV